MRRRRTRPLLRGHGQHKPATPPRISGPTSGLESAQQKRYLRCLEAEQAEVANASHV